MTTAAAESFDPELLRTLRAAPWRTIERRFLFILTASIGLHVVFATYVAAQPMPISESQLDGLQDRVPQRVTLPPLLKIPKAPMITAAAAVAARPKLRGAPSKAIDEADAARQAVLRVVGSVGPGGAFKDLLDAPADEIAVALRDARGSVLLADGPVGPRGPITGSTASIEPIGTAGAKTVSIGARIDKAPATATAGNIVVEDPDELDPRVLQQFIHARRSAVQHCYEREIRHNPALKGGKVVLRMAIGAGGRVSGVRIEEDTLGSAAVTSCMSTLMSRWIFPVAPREEVPLSVPFVFARAN